MQCITSLQYTLHIMHVQYGATLQHYIQYHTHIVEVIGYGNTGCGVFKGGIQNKKGFWLKIYCQMKSLNFANWCNGEVSKSAEIWHSKSIFYSNNHPNLSDFFFIEEYKFRSTLFCYLHFLIFQSICFPKWRPIFDSLPLLKIQ